MFQRSLRITQPGSLQAEQESFAGGAPRIPPEFGWPTCRLCGGDQTFFFQIAFPNGHAWSGRSLAMFACTSCADAQHPIPEMVRGPLHGATVPANCLHAYQRNFRTLVFETDRGVLRAGHPGVEFCPIAFDDLLSLRTGHGRIGGRPQWLLDPEAPARVDSGEPFHFLLQLSEGLRFPILPGAREQMVTGLDGRPQPMQGRFYQLFIANRLFFFGAGADSVYILTQI
jgi:hypothetical protein